MKDRSEAPPQTPPDAPVDGGDPEAMERQKMLGLRLKTLFDHVVEEQIPDDFMALLNRLDEQEQR